MKTRRYMVIINPISGSGPAVDIESMVMSSLQCDGREVEIRYSERPGHCAVLAAEAVKRNFYAVIAAGGDGTINEVASALRGTSVNMGILPRGSGNGLARHLDMSIDINNALRVIKADNPLPCDYGTANKRPFFCTFGLGFDAAVSHEFATMKRRGLTSYIRSAIKKYVSYTPKEYSISTNGKTVHVKAFLIAVCNASQYGNNAYISPDASIRDGLLDITIIHGGNPLTRAIVGVDLFTGYLKRNVLVQTMQVKQAVIRQNPGPGHVDGDPVNMPEQIRIKCHPGQLRLFVDPKKHTFHPLLTPLRSMHFDFRFHINSLISRLLSKRHKS